MAAARRSKVGAGRAIVRGAEMGAGAAAALIAVPILLATVIVFGAIALDRATGHESL